ncbi:MAG: calcium-binding protein [Pseudomonadota bacterium]
MSTLLGTSDGDLISGMDRVSVAKMDDLRGFGGDDTLRGLQGNDSLYGGSGDDNIRGNWGDDLLRGEDGNDTMIGGAGSDQFQFSLSNNTPNRDVIVDLDFEEGDFISIPQADKTIENRDDLQELFLSIGQYGHGDTLILRWDIDNTLVIKNGYHYIDNVLDN